MSSPALQAKIAKARAFAPNELPKARLCSSVILAAVVEDEETLSAELGALKSGVGANWSLITAIQFMSGRRGGFAADCAPEQERPRLHLAHLIAKHISSDHGLGGVNPPGGIDFEKLRSLVTATSGAQ